MVQLSTSEEWQLRTSQLLQARPRTTRITTKYNIPNLTSAKFTRQEAKRDTKRKRDIAENNEEKAPKIPRATLTLKTYDPESGVVLKFKTDRAAEVGRLIGSLGRVGRYMAALPEKEEVQDVVMEEAGEVEQSVKEAAPVAAPVAEGKPQQGGGKKKKKGKK